MNPAELVFSPSDFVAVFNQTLEYAYPNVIIEGELSNFKISKNRWVYFDVKDEAASVAFFGTVYQLPGPLEDGLMVRIVGVPRLHPKFGFKVNFISIAPVGEGSLKKAADLLMAKLTAEGLFAPERKRALPEIPKTIGLITAAESAAAADFVKILNERWGGIEILLADCLVQGDQAAAQITKALNEFNSRAKAPDVIVVTRGGGSAEDLAAFNDERLVRAIAASRVPTIVAIGHEINISMAEMAADQRASTPSNAAQIVVPDKIQTAQNLQTIKKHLSQSLNQIIDFQKNQHQERKQQLRHKIEYVFESTRQSLNSYKRLAQLFNPETALRRGYAIVSRGNNYITSAEDLRFGDKISLKFYDGKIGATVEEREK